MAGYCCYQFTHTVQDHFYCKRLGCLAKKLWGGKQERLDNGVTDRAYGHDADDNKKVSLVTAVTDTAKAFAYYSGGASNSDYATVKYNSEGILQWIQRYNGPDSRGDAVTSLQVDISGNVYVTGNSDAISTSTDFATIKYTQGAGTCNAPAGKTITNITSSSATFSWTSSSGAVSYNVRYRLAGTSTWTTGSTTTTSFNATGLNPNTNYEWQVQSACGGSGGSSLFSSSTTFNTGVTPGCNTPTGLNAGNITNSSAFLSWTAVNGAVSYNLQWKRASSGSWTTVSDLTTNSYNLTGLSSRKDYQFRVRAICSSASGAYISTASFRTSGSQSILNSKASNTFDFKLYPNPANDNLTFLFTGVSDGSVKVNVYNMWGQKVMNIVNPSTKGSNVFNLNISKLGIGIYFFEMENNGQRQQQKFWISR